MPASPASRTDLQSKERALAALATAKREMGRPRRIMRQVLTGQVHAEELETVLLRRIHAGAADLDREGRAALLRLLLHVERHGDLLHTSWGAPQLGRREGNSLVEGLVALTRHHQDWLRPVTAWRPLQRDPLHQFASLARHLLARYEVPPFMDDVWFKGAGPEARRQQAWFGHIGAGHNIRTADLPLRLSKKMAHHFLEAPGDGTVEQALRWGQILGLKGTPDLAAAVNATRLGRSFEHEEFWLSVLQYFVRHPDLDGALVRPIVDYIYYRKYVPRETIGPHGLLEVGSPPEPNFAMKSRSLPKLLRRLARWQRRLDRRRALPAGPLGLPSSSPGLLLPRGDPSGHRPLLAVEHSGTLHGPFAGQRRRRHEPLRRLL